MKLVDNEGIIKNQLSKTLLYIGNEGAVTLEVILDQIKETMWVNQKTMAIFGVNVRTINEHIINIFKTNELDEISTIQKFWIVQNEGNRQIEREVKFYNLDVIISVGYRVNSKEGTQFRIWATKVLKEFLIKGFVLDDELLKNGSRFGKDFFDELLERIRKIRTSERRFNQNLENRRFSNV